MVTANHAFLDIFHDLLLNAGDVYKITCCINMWTATPLFLKPKQTNFWQPLLFRFYAHLYALRAIFFLKKENKNKQLIACS